MHGEIKFFGPGRARMQVFLLVLFCLVLLLLLLLLLQKGEDEIT